MSFSYVKAYYGPCDSIHGFQMYKPQKLQGLKDRLQKIGFRVDLIPVSYINYCMLEMCGYQVFQCNIQNLRFNTPYDKDPVCQRAIDAVLKSSAKFGCAHNYLLFWTGVDNELFRRSKYAPKDYWPPKDKPKASVTFTKQFSAKKKEV